MSGALVQMESTVGYGEDTALLRLAHRPVYGRNSRAATLPVTGKKF